MSSSTRTGLPATPRAALVLLVALSAGGSGCSGARQSAAQKLELGVRHFNEALRWSRFDRASDFLPEDSRADTLDRWRTDADEVRILEYEVESVDQTAPDRADVTVRTSRIHTASNVVEKRRTVQQWEYGEDQKWRVVGERPVKRR